MKGSVVNAYTRTVARCCALVSFGCALAAAAQEAPAPQPGAAQPADLAAASRLVQAGSYDEAERALAALEERHPDDPPLLRMRGEVLVALQRFADALPVLRRCADLDPTLTRVQFQLGTALVATGDRAGALEAFAREIALNDDANVDGLSHLNRFLLLEQDRDWQRAATELEAALGLGSAAPEAWGDLAMLHLEAGRPEEAARALDSGLAAGFRSARHLYSVGAAYFKKKEFVPAGDAFRKALEVEPENADAARSLGMALDAAGQKAEALQHFRRYLELRPDAADAAQIAERIRAAGGG